MAVLTEKNEELRETFSTVLEDTGIKLTFISKKLDIEYTTLCKWKSGKMNFAKEKLGKVEGFVTQHS